jgi:DNA gyrase subunit A
MVITALGQVVRMHADEIRTTGRSAQGVRVVSIDAEDRVVAVARTREDEDEGEEGAEAMVDTESAPDADEGGEEQGEEDAGEE